MGKTLAMKTGLQERIRDGLLPYRYVTAAYLLGSAVTGRMRPDSDIDLAVLIGSGDALEWERRLRIASALEQLVVPGINTVRRRPMLFPTPIPPLCAGWSSGTTG